jgi:hypothetical protein
VTRRRGRRRNKLLDDLKDRREYTHLKEEALGRTMWRNLFGRGVGPVVRQNNEWMNIQYFTSESRRSFSRRLHVSILHNTQHMKRLFPYKQQRLRVFFQRKVISVFNIFTPCLITHFYATLAAFFIITKKSWTVL